MEIVCHPAPLLTVGLTDANAARNADYKLLVGGVLIGVGVSFIAAPAVERFNRDRILSKE
jgi:hypothetical protein